MNEWKPILRLARRSLITLLVVVVLSAAAVYGLGSLAERLKASVGQLQGSTQEVQAQLDAKRDNLQKVTKHIQRYEELRTKGLIGMPDRPQWAEDLQSSYQNIGLNNNNLKYQLQAPKPLNAGSPAQVPADPAATEPLAHDLQFEVADVHELDVLGLIQDYHNRVKGRFRVNSCHLHDAKETGLTAQCVLRFFTIPVAPVLPPQAPAATPG
jgi:hypothetical protein